MKVKKLFKKRLSFKQRLHLQDLHEKRKALYKARIENILNYDLNFYRFKSGKLNVSKMSRCSGLSHRFLSRHLWLKGLDG